MSEILRLPDDCSGQCQNCGHHNQEKCERAVLETAEDEFEKAYARMHSGKGITPIDLRHAHKNDVRRLYGLINELTKQRYALAKRCCELEITAREMSSPIMKPEFAEAVDKLIMSLLEKQ